MSNVQQLAGIVSALSRRGGIKRLGGLRASINKLKGIGYNPNQYKTLYHSTLASNWRHGIRQGGLQTRFANTSKGTTSLLRAPTDAQAIYAAPRRVAKAYSESSQQYRNIQKQFEPIKSPMEKLKGIINTLRGHRSLNEKNVLLKFKAPRSDVLQRKTIADTFGHREYLVGKNVPPHMIRRVKVPKVRRVK